MKRPLLFLLATVWGALPVLLPAAEFENSPIEQKLFDDMSARMQEQLHHTAGLLEKIRQSRDVKEREALMAEYHKSMKTTMKIDHLMYQIADSGIDPGRTKGKTMKGKKMGGMSCCMMGKKSPAKQSGDDSNDVAAPSATDEAPEKDTTAPEEGHEGHH